MPVVQDAICFWNNHREDIAYENALVMYKYDLLREHLLLAMKQALNEFSVVAEYYRNCRGECIQASTTVISTLNEISSKVDDRKQWVLQEEKIARGNGAIVEEYFAQRNILVISFKNEAQKEFGNLRKERDTEILKKIAIQQQVNVGFCGGPRKDDDEGEEKAEDLSSSVTISKDDAPHMFGNRPGHLIDTPANRKLLIELGSNKNNFLGLDKHGNEWYGKIIADGRQLWASMRNQVIRNGGINNPPRIFHPDTGLCKPFKSFK